MFSACLRPFAGLLVLLGALVAAPRAEAGVDIRVNLSTQTLTATTPEGETRRWAISSGRDGYRTIRGTYRPYLMKPYHWSKKYGGAMPHAIFFKGGFAIHGTSATGRLGRPASHGCIRLAPGAARELYAMVKEHGPRSTRIAIRGDAPGVTQYAAAKPKKRTEPAVARARMRSEAVTVARVRLKKQELPAMARARERSPGWYIVAPAYAPIEPLHAPGYQRIWQRLR
jgi:hypothetical protein